MGYHILMEESGIDAKYKEGTGLVLVSLPGIVSFLAPIQAASTLSEALDAAAEEGRNEFRRNLV